MAATDETGTDDSDSHGSSGGSDFATADRSYSRRDLLRAGGVASVAAVAGCSSLGGGSDELVISSYGGAFDDVMETVLDAFEEEADVTTSLVPYTGVSEIESMSDDPDIDVALLDDFDVVAGGTDLFVELDPDVVTRYDAQYESAYLPNDSGISHIFGAYGLAYNTEQWGESDFDSWTNLWDDRFAGELAIQNNWPHFMVMAARAWGGDSTNMDPLWERLPALSENVEVFYEEFAAPERLFSQGQASVASWFDGRTYSYRDAGNPFAFAIPEEGAAQVRGAIAAVQNGGLEETAQRFIDHMLKPEMQVLFAEDLYYGPTNSNVELSDDVAADVVTESDLDSLVVPDWEYITDNREQLTNNWQENI